MKEDVLLSTDFTDLKLYKRGKVRDVYELGDKLLIISSDRISCFDVVLGCGIPYKGKILTKISCFWFDFIKNIIPNHFITNELDGYPEELQKYKAQLLDRSMLVKKTQALPVECVVRGYLSGSGWKEYQKKHSICGINLPAGLRQSDKLPQVLFTPATKEDTGHDINVDQAYIEKEIGKDIPQELKRISTEIYKKASKYALAKGIIIAATKFEFGMYNNKIMLIDEVLTPDSSRFWPLDQYTPGSP